MRQSMRGILKKSFVVPTIKPHPYLVLIDSAPLLDNGIDNVMSNYSNGNARRQRNQMLKILRMEDPKVC